MNLSVTSVLGWKLPIRCWFVQAAVEDKLAVIGVYFPDLHSGHCFCSVFITNKQQKTHTQLQIRERLRELVAFIIS